MSWRVITNTDSADIDNQCLGLSVSNEAVPRECFDNRGLHIQIRHNRDKTTFEHACYLQRLLAAAPEMLDFIRRVVTEQADFGDHGDQVIIREGEELIRKAEGR